MRKLILAVPLVAAAAISTAAVAQPAYPPPPGPPPAPASAGDYYGPGPAPGVAAAGVVTGTVVGLGFSQGWWSAPAALTTTAGAAAVGGAAGIGAIALIDAFTRPCHGFRIAIDPPEYCAQLTAQGAPPERVARHVVRHHRYYR